MYSDVYVLIMGQLCNLTIVLTQKCTSMNETTVMCSQSCADPEGGGGQGIRTPPPPENHKIGFLSNTGPDPLKK